jgi:pimeloyl-ACP methyl ester carboxylesterase
MVHVMERISEQVVSVGKRKSLVGIITRTVGSSCQIHRPAVVILNTGIIHRVGHHRMYVDLSRVLAKAGHTVLRFDLSGIGDSDSRAEALPPWESVFADIQEVLDWMESAQGIRRIVLVGLCSGADHAVYYGSSDPRVVGLVLMDPTIPPTPRYGRRSFRLRSWLNAAIGRLGIGTRLANLGAQLFGRASSARSVTAADPEMRTFLESLYQRSARMGKQFLTILTAGQDTRHSYPEQLIDAFPNVRFEGLLKLEFLDDCDHTFSFESDRVRLARLVLDWLRETQFAEPIQASREHSTALLWLFCPTLLLRLSTYCLFPLMA